jgi:hypothetical protein
VEKKAEEYRVARKSREPGRFEEYHKLKKRVKLRREIDRDARFDCFLEELEEVKTPEMFYKAARPLYKEMTPQKLVKASKKEAEK